MIYITAAEGKYYFSDVVTLTSRQSTEVDEQTLTRDQLEGLKDGYQTGRLIMSSGDYTKLFTTIEDKQYGGGTAPYSSLTGNADKVLTVNATEDGVEWTTPVTQVYVDTQDSSLQDQIDSKADAASVTQPLSTKADLINGVIPTSQLPSYVDDVLNFPDLASFPSLGEDGKIYIAVDVNKTYRWGGSSYVEIGGGGVALYEMERAASLLLLLILGLPSATVCAVLPAKTCLRSSSKRLVRVGDEFSQGTKPQAQTEAGDGCWRVTKRCQQGDLDREIHQPVL